MGQRLTPAAPTRPRPPSRPAPTRPRLDRPRPRPRPRPRSSSSHLVSSLSSPLLLSGPRPRPARRPTCASRTRSSRPGRASPSASSRAPSSSAVRPSLPPSLVAGSWSGAEGCNADALPRPTRSSRAPPLLPHLPSSSPRPPPDSSNLASLDLPPSPSSPLPLPPLSLRPTPSPSPYPSPSPTTARPPNANAPSRRSSLARLPRPRLRRRPGLRRLRARLQPGRRAWVPRAGRRGPGALPIPSLSPSALLLTGGQALMKAG